MNKELLAAELALMDAIMAKHHAQPKAAKLKGARWVTDAHTGRRFQIDRFGFEIK